MTKFRTPRRLVATLAGALLAVNATMTYPQGATRTVWDGVYTLTQADDGRELYDNTCASCHGTNLRGIEAAPALVGPAFNVTWNGTSLDGLVDRIRLSMPAGAPGSLTRREVTDILAYMLNAGGFPAGEVALARETTALQQIRFITTQPE